MGEKKEGGVISPSVFGARQNRELLAPLSLGSCNNSAHGVCVSWFESSLFRRKSGHVGFSSQLSYTHRETTLTSE